jgi:hypothetical protein
LSAVSSSLLLFFSICVSMVVGFLWTVGGSVRFWVGSGVMSVLLGFLSGLVWFNFGSAVILIPVQVGMFLVAHVVFCERCLVCCGAHNNGLRDLIIQILKNILENTLKRYYISKATVLSSKATVRKNCLF